MAYVVLLIVMYSYSCVVCSTQEKVLTTYCLEEWHILSYQIYNMKNWKIAEKKNDKSEKSSSPPVELLLC